MSGLEEIAAGNRGETDWRRQIPWVNDRDGGEHSVRIREAELLALIDEWLSFSTQAEHISKPASSLLETWLAGLQRLIGCQGMGLFLPTADEWNLEVRLGGRSLGRPTNEWLNATLTSGQPHGRLNDPAEGWGQLAFPFRCRLLSEQTGVLVISARHPDVLDLDALEELIPLLGRVSQFVAELQQSLRSANREAEIQAATSRLLAARNPAELLSLFATAVQRLAENFASCFIAVPPGSTAVYHIQHEHNVQPLDGINSGDAIACFYAHQTAALPEIFAQLPVDSSSERAAEAICLPFAADARWRGGCLFWPKESSQSNAEPDRLLDSLFDSLQPLVTAWERRWSELLEQQHSVHRSAISFLPVDELAERYCRETLEQVAGSFSSSRGPVLLAGEPGTPLIPAVRFLQQADAAVQLLDCRLVSETRFREQLQEWTSPLEAAALPVDRFAAQAATRGGLLVLHEVGDLSPAAQQELLTALRRPDRGMSIRIVSTTSVDLQQRVHCGEFSEQLLLQLGTVRLHLPPLRSQPELVVSLFKLALKQAGSRYGLAEDAVVLLQEYSWPENLEELRQVAFRLRKAEGTVANDSETISRVELQVAMERKAAVAEELAAGLTDATLEFQRQHIRRAIARAGGNMTEAARLLDLHRSNLYRKMNQLNMAEAGTGEDDE